MIRMLLTFLALMTGLAASGAPTLAQAMEPRAVVSFRYATPGARACRPMWWRMAAP
jgi:hypothetical protein